MGKKQHQKDKLYLSRSEWVQEGGGKVNQIQFMSKSILPFDHCALSLAPVSDPVCTPDGTVFDITNILPYIRKFKKHPVTGEKLDADQLIYLHFHKNSQGKYHCPLTFKEFTQNSYIVAIRTSGNVFCYEAIQEFNVKPGIWKDMIDDTKFSKEDIITIQNPAIDQRKWFDPETLKKNTAELDLSKQEVHSTVTKDEPLFTGKRLVKSVRSTSDKKEESVLKKPKVSDEPKKVQNPPTLLTSGACAASFTSTTLAPNTKNPVLAKTDSQMREEIYKKVRKLKSKNKAFVQMETTKGTLVIQLECDKAPRTCHNFVLLCKSGYYNNIKFHRMIPGFMIQGGDPKGNGRGGESAWKDKFADEFTPELRHDRRGILSMANSGPNTNGSQFFITFAPCPHLDNRHTVFGQVIEGDSVLTALERLPTDNSDRPMLEAVILDCAVLSEPFSSFENTNELSSEAAGLLAQWRNSSSTSAPTVGKYLQHK